MFIRMACSTPAVPTAIWTCVERDLALGSKFASVLLHCYPIGTLSAYYTYRNVNIPWETQGMTDGDYLYAFQEIVMPIAQEFNPDLVIGKTPFVRYLENYLNSI
jgi:hypothetical protein